MSARVLGRLSSASPGQGRGPPVRRDSFAVEDCGLGCAVLDMEAYALAKACRVAGAEFACVKYVTDGANQVAADDWRNNVHRAAARFLALFKELDRISAIG